MQQGKSRTTWN